MRQSQLFTLPPSIVIPQTINQVMQCFTANSKKEAKLIFARAIKEVFGNTQLSKQQLRSAYALFSSLEPADDIERIFCAQFVVTHILGMHHLSLPSPRDKGIGLKLLQAATNAMERLHNKRHGGLSNDLEHTENN